MYMHVYITYALIYDIFPPDFTLYTGLIRLTRVIQIGSLLWLVTFHCTCTIFFVHASVSGHIVCIHVLAIVNSMQ